MRYFVGWLLVCLVCGSSLAQGQQTELQIITAADAFDRSSAGGLVLVDIRSEDEWIETGIATTARTVSMHESDGASGFIKRLLAELDGVKSRDVALICATGGRSAKIFRFLSSHGFTSVYDVSEGMLGNFRGAGWLKGKLPTRVYQKAGPASKQAG